MSLLDALVGGGSSLTVKTDGVALPKRAAVNLVGGTGVEVVGADGSDTQVTLRHANAGGGPLHTSATSLLAGFMGPDHVVDLSNCKSSWQRATYVYPTGNAATDTNALNTAANLARTNHYSILLGQGQFNVNDDELQWHNFYGTVIEGVGCAQASSAGTITDGTTIKFVGTRRAGSCLLHMNASMLCSVRGIHFKAGDEATPNATVENLIECGIGMRSGGTTGGGVTYPAETVRQPTFNTFYNCHFTGVLTHAATSTTSRTLSETSIAFSSVSGTWPTSSHVLVRSSGGNAVGYGTVSSFSGGTLTVAFSYVRNNGAPAAHTDWRIHAVSNGLYLPLASNTIVRQCRMTGLFWFADVSGSNATKILSCAMDENGAFGPQIVGGSSCYGLRVENFITEGGVDGWNCLADLDTVFGATLNFVNGDQGSKGNAIRLDGSVDVTIEGGAIYSSATDGVIFSNGTEGLTIRNVNGSSNGPLVDFRGTSPSKRTTIDAPTFTCPAVFAGEAGTNYQQMRWRGADGVAHHSDSLEAIKLYSLFGLSIPIADVNLATGVDVSLQTAIAHVTTGASVANLHGIAPFSDEPVTPGVHVYSYFDGTANALTTPQAGPHVYFIHDDNFTFTIFDESGSETVASWRVRTGTGANVVVPACTGGRRYVIELQYFPAIARWVLVAVHGLAMALAYQSETDDGNSGTTKTLTFSALSVAHKVTLTGNCTFTINFPTEVGSYVLELYQDSTGGRTVTLPSSFKNKAAIEATLNASTTLSTFNVLSIFWNGSYAVGAVIATGLS